VAWDLECGRGASARLDMCCEASSAKHIGSCYTNKYLRGMDATTLKSHRVRDDDTQAPLCPNDPRLDIPRKLHQILRLKIRDHSETAQESSTIPGVERLRNSEVGATSEVLLKRG
jgi:hypothetical protein